MNLTTEQIAALAPDASSLAAGRKLGATKDWKNLGQSPAALWGECQGSALYQVRVDLREFAYNCSCPSRKLPCKHVLGLLFLATGSAKAVATGEPPEWVATWLTKRDARAQQREEKKEKEAKPVDAAAQAKRAEQREKRVADGLNRLDLWLGDLVRQGLAGLEQRPPAYWEEPAKRLVDAQAPGLAARLRAIGELPGSHSAWPETVLGQLGRLALITHAYGRLGELDAPLQADVRQMIGWTIQQDELAAQGGESFADEWLVLGQRVEDEERLKVQRSWLLGARTHRSAVVLQFSAGGQPFSETIVPGTRVEGELIFWPSALPQRARFLSRAGETGAIDASLPGHSSWEDFLGMVSQALARQPWLDRFLAVANGVQVVPRPDAEWMVRDQAGQALPLRTGTHWTLLALAGGQPVDLVAEWNGRALRPLGAWVEGGYCLLPDAS
jgi:hypothetical protein